MSSQGSPGSPPPAPPSSLQPYGVTPPRPPSPPAAQGAPQGPDKQRIFRAERSYAVRAGKWYFEFEAVTTGEMRVGWARPHVRPDTELGADELAFVFNGHRVSTKTAHRERGAAGPEMQPHGSHTQPPCGHIHPLMALYSPHGPIQPPHGPICP